MDFKANQNILMQLIVGRAECEGVGQVHVEVKGGCDEWDRAGEVRGIIIEMRSRRSCGERKNRMEGEKEERQLNGQKT